MKLEFVLDGKKVSLNINSDKPLSLILAEDLAKEFVADPSVGSTADTPLFINDELVQPYLVPAFRLRQKDIRTFNAFRKTRLCRDIERAYATHECFPEQESYAALTMVIESLLADVDTPRGKSRITTPEERGDAPPEESSSLNVMAIEQDLRDIAYTAMDPGMIILIARTAADYRRRRSVRRN